MAGKPGKNLPPNIGPPISAGFVRAERTISRRKYTLSIEDSKECFRDQTNDNSLYFDGDLSPKLTKAGKVAKRQPHIEKKGVRWWKAQCGFRGLPVSGTVSDLQQRAQAHGAKGLGRELEEARNAMRTEIENEVGRRWESMNADEKVAAWPRRFLHETFLKDRNSKTPVHVVNVRGEGNEIEAACKAMGVCCELRRMPHYGPRTVVLSMDEQAARSKLAELDRHAEKVILEQRKVREREEKEWERERERKEKERERAEREKSRVFDSRFSQAAEIQKSDKGNWDVSGKWTIDCPYVQEQWGSCDALNQWGPSVSTCELEIKVTAPNSAGMVQMWATFNFIALTGVFRFVNPEVKSETISSAGHTRGARGIFEDDFVDESDDERMDDEGISPAQFLFPRSALPSSTSKKFQFRWRGEETGEGEIQLDSDRDLCCLTFESKDALSGDFKSDLTGSIKFRGVRERCSSDKPLNLGQKRKHESIYEDSPEDEWRSRSKAAYERARVGRWR